MSEAIDDFIETIDSEDGYLTAAWLERLRAIEFTVHAAARFLVWLPNIKPHLACCFLSLAHGETDLGKPAHFLEFHTGGWSGAEELIDAMLGHFWIKYFHTKWLRGGHFTFAIPEAQLRLPSSPPDEPQDRTPRQRTGAD